VFTTEGSTIDSPGPLLVLTGDDDRIIPGASSEVLAERIPEAELCVHEGTGHLFFLEAPDATAALVKGFLAR
jgi:pimeloyl-ACP methyl ester carboxylesterase